MSTTDDRTEPEPDTRAAALDHARAQQARGRSMTAAARSAAEAHGVSPRTVMRWMQGAGGYDLDTRAQHRARIAQALDKLTPKADAAELARIAQTMRQLQEDQHADEMHAARLSQRTPTGAPHPTPAQPASLDAVADAIARARTA